MIHDMLNEVVKHRMDIPAIEYELTLTLCMFDMEKKKVREGKFGLNSEHIYVNIDKTLFMFCKLIGMSKFNWLLICQ